MPDQNAIVSYAIYPGIGIARVGNSPDEYFIGPEAPGQVPQPPGGFKDAAGRIKRQAARFRVYGLNEAGEAVKEITADDAEITWRVHVANRKAGWYQFLNAMDLGKYAMTTAPRNKTLSIRDRARSAAVTSRDHSISSTVGNSWARKFHSGNCVLTKPDV